jgi:hypothetical protein
MVKWSKVLPMHAMKECVRLEVHLQAFLISTLHRGEWSAVRIGYFAPEEGGWVGPRIGLGALEKREISCPGRVSNTDSSSVHPVA